MAKNADLALKLDQARDVIIVAAITLDSSVFECAARQVKQTVVDIGSAEKLIAAYKRILLKLPANVADALAIVIAYCYFSQHALCMSSNRLNLVRRVP